MPVPDLLELARHLDRVRRAQAPSKDGVVVREFEGGWISTRPGADAGEFPSGSMHRMFWLTVPHELSAHQLESGLSTARGLKCRRAYIWLAPWAWSERVEARLVSAGARAWPHVEYVALARPAGECELPRETPLTVRPLRTEEAAGVFGSLGTWYTDDGRTAAVRMAERELVEVHAAFDADRPVAIGLLAMDGDWAYLSAAGTDPAFRRRGAQSALIRSRVRRAEVCGARWATVETNTAVPVSLRNLERCGFERAIAWRVYRWDDRAG